MGKAKLTPIKFKILGRTWKVKVWIDQKKFEKKLGDVHAVTWSNRIIELGPTGCDIETIRHELVHAYQKEMCIGSTSEMTNDDMEEFIAELIGRRGPELLQKADELYAAVKCHLNSNS